MDENRKKETIRVIKFVLFSISAGVIEFGSFTLLTEFTGNYLWRGLSGGEPALE